MAVATPVPATALAGPGSEPVRGVSDAPGGSGAVPVTAMGTPAVPPSRVLTLGEGEGRQPAPGYPRAAVRERQEGTVRVGLDVGPDGRVQAAAVLSSSGWPLLDEAALRTVRLRWQFGPGPLRRYEVPFHFNLRK
jgi:protein TonB